MAGKTYVASRGGVLVEEYSLQESLGPSSAGGLVALGDDGLIDQSMLPTSGGGGKMVVPKKQLFTANGSWVKPAGFVEGTLTATGIGGGAGGPRHSASFGYSGGNAGQWVYQTPIDISDITVGSIVPVTIGNGGAALGGGSSGVAGNSGSPTSFGTKLVLAGAIGAPVTGASIRAVSVGGALGGVRQSTMYVNLMVQSNNCAVGAPLNMLTFQGNTTADGAPGLILDASGIKGGDTTNGLGGLGYGAGGAGNGGAATGAGAKGALLLEWWEVVE